MHVYVCATLGPNCSCCECGCWARVVSRVGSAVVSMGRGMWRVVPTLDNTPLTATERTTAHMHVLYPYPSFTFDIIMIHLFQSS